MNFTDFLLWKALALCVLIVVVNFIYAAITGRSIEEVLRGKPKD